jgi:hypothetical protein
MAIYSFHASPIGRGQGKSACASAAYNARIKIYDRTQGITFNYQRKGKDDIIAEGILAPDGSPDWTKNRSELWNRVQEKENRKNSRFARQFIIALPHEFTHQQGEAIIREFFKENFSSRGLVCDYAIHPPDKKGDHRNFHAHILVTTRSVTGNNLKENDDGWGEKNREVDRTEFLTGLRKSWADSLNLNLKKIGSPERVDHRSLADQGVYRDPQKHQGVTATAMEREGKMPDRKRQTDHKKMPIITEREIANAMNADPEVRQILTAIEVLNNPEKFEQYQNIQTGNAIADVVKNNVEIINREYQISEQKAIHDEVKHLQKIPHQITEKKMLPIYTYQDDTGKNHSNYEDYKKAQGKIISIFDNEGKWIQEEKEKNKVEQEHLNKARQTNSKKDYVIVATDNQYRRPGLYKMIIQKAQELLEKAKQFEPFRELKAAIYEMRKIRKQEQEQSQKRNISRRNDRGMSK